ncbi:MAG: lysophospholipid acyltransferase family protein, partial [Planctomycetota bacterium]
VLRAAGGGSHELCRQVTYSHVEPFRERRAAGQPLIILQSHFGNFDLVAYAFATQGFPLHTVMKKLRNKKLNELLVTTRQQHDITVHLKGKETFSTLREALQRGDWIGVLPDQRPRRGRGVEVQFLGKPARLFQGPALLHLETGAPIAYCFGTRQNEPGRHHVTFEFLTPRTPTEDREADVRAVMQQIADAMERAIRRHPDHYFWFHRLWGKRLGATV